MRVHHDKHHQAYVDQRQRGARRHRVGRHAGRGGAAATFRALPEDKRTPVRNNAGGHYNHRCSGSGCLRTAAASPTARCARRSTRRSATFDDFKAKFKEPASGRFGSGWAWLVHDGSGLAIVSTANQDNPISDGKTPLLGVDVWEHAYYLKYQNRRPDYLDAWWNVVNWSKVAQGFAEVD